MAKRIMLSESKLRNIIKKTILFEQARKVIEEGMVAPNSIKQIWKNDDAYIVKGGNGRYYDVYPSYNDSYIINSDCDDLLDKICKKIERSFQKNNISGHAFVYNLGGEGEIIVEIRDWLSDGKFTDKFAQMLQTWMEGKGFSLREFDEAYNSYHYVYNNYETSISDENLSKKLSGYEDCTDVVEQNARRMGIVSPIQIFKRLDSLSKPSSIPPSF